MHSHGASRAAEVSFVGLERSDDELPLELVPGLLEGNSPPNQLVNDLRQAAVERMFRHRPLLKLRCIAT